MEMNPCPEELGRKDCYVWLWLVMKKKQENFIRNHGIPRNLVFTTKFRFSEIVSKFPGNLLRFIRRRGFFSTLLLRSNDEVYRIFWQSFFQWATEKTSRKHLIRSLLVNSAPQEIRESGSRPLIGYQHYTLAELTAFPRKSPTFSLVLTKSVPPINSNTKSRRRLWKILRTSMHPSLDPYIPGEKYPKKLARLSL